MDLNRMLAMCRAGQWSIEQIDWTRTPPRLPRAKEEAVCQFFTDMAGIEHLAAALFEAQAEKTQDPVLREIFRSFVADEARHACVAARLAQHYDVHRYRVYEQSPELRSFAPHFVTSVRNLSPELANLYVTVGEMLLDVALLRSVDDYVDDPLSHEAMQFINRDESRHIAVDYHMVEKYAAEDAAGRTEATPGGRRVRDRARAWWSFGHALWYAKPFLERVFLAMLDRTDPSGRRLREAFKRLQLLSVRPTVRRRPLVRYWRGLQAIYKHPAAAASLGPLLLRALGGDHRVASILYTHEERERACRMSIDDLVADALAAKYAS